ncbi:COX15/CtaA family protein [Candidatus Nitrosotalea bavarica]|uniref:COX15/CtaA family protein n=1 Tax=Candidatus Nitrosotalea bavarica TaxID=1903277 RepID=UPI000C70F762|nr:COX15/CtaA family protein [Candidatus Nitrosotalea bavarica]
MYFKYLALASLVILYSLMFIGGYLQASGQGLTCPNWPLCPSGILPSAQFLTEWIHRFIAATTGVLIVATAICAWKTKGSHKKIRITGTLAGVFAVSQIGLGAIVINTKLHAVIVAIHNGVGILLFAMTLLTVLFAFRIDQSQKIETSA